MTAIQPPTHCVIRTRRPAYRYYAAGAIAHAVFGATLVGLGYRSSAGLFVVAGLLAIAAILAWRSKAVIETKSRHQAGTTVLHTDTD